MRFHLVLLSFFIPLCLINLSFNIYVATSHCLGHQQVLLLHMKQNLQFNPTKSKKLVTWNQSEDCCEWNGVTCHNEHVIGLDLSEEFISGALDNSSLSNLESLQDLNLAYNDFQSSIPSEIFKIENLRYLNLSNTNFSGSLPGAISKLKKLSTLDLSNCQFNGTLPVSFSGLIELVHLDLSFNNFTGPLPSLNMFKNLKFLSLFQNGFTGPITTTHWEGLLNLTSIHFGDNTFNGKVPSSLFTLLSLRELILSHNRFSGSLDEFPIPNASLSALNMVDLSNNELQGPIPMSLFRLPSLGYLHLSLNQFNGTLRLDLLQNLQNLRALGISHNNLSVNATFNGSFPSLVVLLLGSCKLREFPAFLRNQSQLRALDISNNQIQGTIPNWIWRFEYMVNMNLSNNFLTGLDGPFENLSSSTFVLDLHSNQLQGSIPILTKNAVYLDYSSNKFMFIPPDIREYLNYTYFLSLSNNSFHGKIPQSFCGCPTLRMLDLSHNSFNGSIPECLISRSGSLRALNILGNKLSGSISDTISSSCNLRFLNLNENLLEGTIPKSLINCKSLQVLNLGNNVFRDRFPCFLRNISALQVLILRSNKLHGSIRCQRNNGSTWKMLHIVDIALNDFTGRLPGPLLKSWIAMKGDEDDSGEKSGNLFFDIYDFHHSVRYKDLLASIDKVLVMKLAQLQVGEPLSTIENLFSYFVNAYQFQWGGSYLDSVTVVSKGLQMNLVKILAVFTFLDFSSNHFEGSIPEEVMSLRAINVLNLSHNAFSSHIPSSLGNLTQIESLDLSSNNLSGVIPTEIASLSFLSVLNLSYNHLVGKIPTGTQIQTFEEDSFVGNEGLCGPPLNKNCGHVELPTGAPSSYAGYETESSIDWNFLSAELGFTIGFGCVILPLLLWKRWRLWYSKHVDELLFRMFPQLDFVYIFHGGKKYRTLKWRFN
ncbi:receptor-like protein 32 [Lotus japonicus]|uniref:receptor-like protein 32 n=1 Tax=Lotus japonicus TaxID=34305 RepID=UPI0025891413|nr:receptor-like protein 32 [Lotus japonicus]